MSQQQHTTLLLGRSVSLSSFALLTYAFRKSPCGDVAKGTIIGPLPLKGPLQLTHCFPLTSPTVFMPLSKKALSLSRELKPRLFTNYAIFSSSVAILLRLKQGCSLESIIMIWSLKNSLKMCTNVHDTANNIESLLICRHDATNFRKAVKGMVTREETSSEGSPVRRSSREGRFSWRG